MTGVVPSLPDDYFVRLGGEDWEWGIAGEVWGDDFASELLAASAALEHWESTQPEWCDRCGDQAVCPDCVGT